MKFYLAGPMTGLPEHNYPAFAEARERIRKEGHEIFCPAEHALLEGYEPTTPVTKEWVQDKMRVFLSTILDSDGIVVLPGWARSEGAKVEVATAVATGKKIFQYHKHRPISLEELNGVQIVTRAEVLK